MPTKTPRRSESGGNQARNDARNQARSEARRRARLAARGEVTDEGEVDAGATAATRQPPTAPRRGFLEALFPAAPPLPGKPDPLAGFTAGGPARLRGVATSLYLLRKNPLAWLLPGVAWAVVQPFNFSNLSLVAALVGYSVLIAAGWFGWQRPWLFGLIAAILGFVLSAGLELFFLASGRAATVSSADLGAIGVALLLNGSLYGAIGLLAGFYGGYLRRRMASTRTPQRGRAGRRR